MNITVQICIIVLTVFAVVASVYFVLALLQVKRAAKEVEKLAISLKGISDFMASPWSSVLSIAGKLFSDFIARRNKLKQEE